MEIIKNKTLENEIILKKLRRKQFDTLIRNKKILVNLIEMTLKTEKNYIKKNIKYKYQKIKNTNDLITNITENKIIIKTSIENKEIKKLKKKDKFYKIYCNEKKQEFTIKIYIDKIFESKYKIIEQQQKEKIKELFKNEPITEEDIVSIIIAELAIKYCKKIEIRISGTI